MQLYEEILYLMHSYKGLWIVENVVPYYGVLLPATKIGRHLFWSNFTITAQDIKRPRGFIKQVGKKALQEWLGIHYKENIYYGNNHCPAQILRNCVHPLLGEQVYQCAVAHLDAAL